MAKAKKGIGTGAIVGIVIGVLAIGGGIFYFIRKKKKQGLQPMTPAPTPSRGGGNIGGRTGSSKSTKGGSGIYTPKPSSSISQVSNSWKGGGSTSSITSTGCGGSYTNISFPLQKGSCGGNVVKVQKYLGITADGKFGSGTEKAVKGVQNAISSNNIGWSAGYGKISKKDFDALPI